MMVLLVVVGGGVGAVSRWFVTVWLGTSSTGFPIGTTVVNVVGSFLLGVLVGLDSSIGGSIRDPLAIGLLGGFTTFSTWMVEIDRGESTRAQILVGTIPLFSGLMAATIGLGLGSLLGSAT